MSRRGWIGVVVAAAVVILLVTYFWNRSHYVQGEGKELSIGAVFDLTGSLSYMGQWSLEGAKLAEQEVNEAGGIGGRPIRLLIEDAETNPQKAATILRRFISVNKVPLVIGFNGSSEVMASAPIANKERVVLFSTGAASPHITAAGDYVFRNRLSGALEAGKMAEIAFGMLELRTGMILYIKTDYGEGYAQAFRNRFIELGGNVVAVETFQQGQTDFRAQLSKVTQAQGIEFVYLASHVREAAGILRQAREQDVSQRWLASNAIEAPELFEIAGEAAEGVILTVAKYAPNDPYAKEFNRVYRDVYGRDSEMFAAHAYDAVKLLAEKIEEVGYDSDRIRDALYEVRGYRGVSGTTSFDENGDVIKPVATKIAQNGRFVEIPESRIHEYK